MSAVAVKEATPTARSRDNVVTAAKRKRGTAVTPTPGDDPLCRTLILLDPILQFLTKATGQNMVPLKSLLSTVPNAKIPYADFLALLRHGVLQLHPSLTDGERDGNNIQELKKQWDLGKNCDAKFTIGFPSPDERRLSGSTKTATKRRLAALKRQIKQGGNNKAASAPNASEGGTSSAMYPATNALEMPASSTRNWTLPVDNDPDFQDEPLLAKEAEARKALKEILGLELGEASEVVESLIPTSILPKQISYAGTHPAQGAVFDQDHKWRQDLDPRIVVLAQHRQLYRHQAVAIESALRNIPTLVCTGTGSGKSLCFLIPVLNAALKGQKSMLLFPTKALAQDQVVKLTAWLEKQGLHDDIRAATLDGDTPHGQRVDIITSCNVILTNPDTLHAAIMPNWKHMYSPLLSNLRYVVMDEAHMYTGVFGAHVSMILARLYRLVSIQCSQLCFLACSATLAHPEAHFRLLCCMSQDQIVNIVKEDGSPRAAKHFWVWNPPLLDMNGKCLGRVDRLRKKHSTKITTGTKKTSRKENQSQQQSSGPVNPYAMSGGPIDISASPNSLEEPSRESAQRRRHSADETALLLALAVSRGVRTIAFCKTRCLVEWVYERTLSALKQSPKTADLCRQVESYRGGYTKAERRQIEERLFNNQLLGVVGTSALELGVDIGGVDLTLHCGFPSSHDNLIQQSGRAGRGSNASTSMAICVCFNSPMDQHLWRHPSSLLSKGYSSPISMPINAGLVQGHLLCAGQEYPLTGTWNASVLKATGNETSTGLLSDKNLFGSPEVYEEAMENLLSVGSLIEEKVATTSGTIISHKTHPSIKKPWTQVSIRSIEPVSYQIVDISHPKQGGRTDRILDEAAILDTIPYSRIFYHAFPGAVITHRNRRYKITCMTRPPAFGRGFRGSVSLGAFAKPCNLRYCTRPLSTLMITVVKQMERVDAWGGKSHSDSEGSEAKHGEVPQTIPEVAAVYSDKGPDPSFGSFAGCGVVTVKRNVHGYKKLSLVTREEISRSELSLPDMEFDSFAFWIDCHADFLAPQLGEMAFGHGVHALAHALVAVAPLFVPCTVCDVSCDHAVYGPTRVTIFDARAGGSGICAQLWKSVFIPNGILEAALGLLEECPSCSDDANYDGGCPACLQAGECIKFNDFLSKSSGLVIAKHMLSRLKETDAYKQNERETNSQEEACRDESDSSSKFARITTVKDVSSPRRKKRERAMRNAQDISSARDRQVVVGRPSWPMDRSNCPRQENTYD